MPQPARKWSPVPREHGAWGMLAQPFLGALVVAGFKSPGSATQWTSVIPAAVAAVGVFLIREPLLVLARQRWVWKDRRPETAEAAGWIAIEALFLSAAGIWLAFIWPLWLVIALGAGSALLTALATWFTIRNTQRAIWFQGLSAAGLSASGLGACLALTGGIAPWAWWWWGLHAAHFFAGILVVHVRLEARIAARRGSAKSRGFLEARNRSAIIEGALAAAGIAVLVSGYPWFGAAAIASAAWHFWNLYTAHTPGAVATPMTSVGKRALAASIAFSILVGVGAWRSL